MQHGGDTVEVRLLHHLVLLGAWKSRVRGKGGGEREVRQKHAFLSILLSKRHNTMHHTHTILLTRSLRTASLVTFLLMSLNSSTLMPNARMTCPHFSTCSLHTLLSIGKLSQFEPEHNLLPCAAPPPCAQAPKRPARFREESPPSWQRGEGGGVAVLTEGLRRGDYGGVTIVLRLGRREEGDHRGGGGHAEGGGLEGERLGGRGGAGRQKGKGPEGRRGGGQTASQQKAGD